MELNFLFFLTVVPAIILYGIAKSGLGGSMTLISVPLMTIVMPLNQALGIILPILIIVGYKTKLSAILLASFCVVTAINFHLDFTNQMQVIALLKNFGLAGGFIFIAINGPKDWALDQKKK